VIIRINDISKKEKWFVPVYEEGITVALSVISIVIFEFQNSEFGAKLFSLMAQ
jgi:hypothetical protein